VCSARPDVVEELLLLGALEDKVVIGSMNRGGLDGATWTMDDRFTGTTPRASRESGSRAARCCSASTTATPAPPDPRGLRQARHRARRRGLLAMVEPLPYHREDDGVLRLLKDVAVAGPAVTDRQRLGTTSAHTWLKMPSCDDPERCSPPPPAVRRARRRPEPRPARGPRVLGPGALPAAVRGLVVGRACSTRPTATCARRRRGGDGARAAARAGMSLHRRAADTGRRAVVDLTPEDAGWDWTGLRVLRLAPGEPTTVRPASRRRSCCRWPAG
jgi:hypothetical protein